MFIHFIIYSDYLQYNILYVTNINIIILFTNIYREIKLSTFEKILNNKINK